MALIFATQTFKFGKIYIRQIRKVKRFPEKQANSENLCPLPLIDCLNTQDTR